MNLWQGLSVRLLASHAEYDRFLDAADIYWETNTLPPGPGWIITEALHQDIRVTLRNLTVANSLRRFSEARVLVVTGTDTDWFSALFSRFEVSHVRRLCDAFGAEMINIHDLVDARIASGGHPPRLVIGGSVVPPTPPEVQIDPLVLEECVESTICRLKRMPRLPPGYTADPEYRRLHRRCHEFSTVYDQLMTGLRPMALITSHVDYNQWGLAVESAMRLDTPVVHTQATGSLKAYALFPDRKAGLPTFRSELTRQIGSYFNDHIWPNRAVLRRSAELVAWRSKANLGRPSWWRAGAGASADLVNGLERDHVRAHALARYGFDPTLPVVAVFNHAVSDARRTNHESFPDLAAWFAETVSFADQSEKANWLLLDHPSQGLYDVTGFFAGLAREYAGRPHIVFRRSNDVPKNILWSLIDLGVTVRGSVSNELPAYGIPVVQAGWSEWSDCGLSLVAEDRDSYFGLVQSSLAALRRGESLISDEQVERARLWLWFYRCGSDVVSSLVPTWHEGDTSPMLRSLRIYMNSVESDGDPVFRAVERMWERREPFLTRFDLTCPETLRQVVLRDPAVREPIPLER